MKFTGVRCKTLFLESNDKVSKIHSRSQFLVSFFNLFYTSGFIPISILDMKSEFNGTYTYHFTSSTFKKLASGLMQGAVLWSQVLLTITPWIYSYESNSFIGAAIQFLNNIFGVIYVLVAIHLLWYQQEKLLNLLNCTRTTVQHGKLMNRLPVALLIVAFTYTILMVHDHLDGSQLYFLPMRNGSLAILLRQSCILKMEDQDGGCSWWMWALYLLFKFKLIIVSYSMTFFFFNHYFFLFLALSMLDLAEEFIHKLKETDTIDKVIELYLIMKMKVKVINDCAGPLVLCYYASHMSFLLKGPDVLMGFSNAARSEKVIYTFCITTTISWILFAESYEKVNSAMENWFEQNLLSASGPISPDYFALEARIKLMSVMNEVKSGSLAISCKYFAITNKFLSSTLGLLVTYLIVGLQTQPKLSS